MILGSDIIILTLEEAMGLRDMIVGAGSLKERQKLFNRLRMRNLLIHYNNLDDAIRTILRRES